MKKILIILLLAIGISQTKAETSSQMFEKAGLLYSQSKYKEATQIYEKILSNDQESAEVYYNLGNIYYKSGKFTKAILNYERAKLLDPSDEDITYNLELANLHIQDKIQPVPQVFFVRWWHHFINLNTANGWGTISLIFFILFLTAAGFFLLTRSVLVKKGSFGIGILFFFVFIFSFGFGWTLKCKFERHDEAIIMAPTVTIKSSPDNNGNNLFIVHEGLKVKITDQIGKWVEIRLSDGNKGWMPDDTMTRI
ncbi:MAG: tetratricopeptide repeat protein [Bacteroidota bacterium]|nr:tetratricopeptide repeat protein [Bacteroidota bacterium]MDP4205213.1 tetratricopeptide repeat protein [Bacteroidota bacterium]